MMTTSTLTSPVTETEFLALWGGDPRWRIIPCFADAWDDVEAAKALLRQAFEDDDVEFVIRGHAAGVELLRHLERRCGGFMGADLFATSPPESVLVLGQVMV